MSEDLPASDDDDKVVSARVPKPLYDAIEQLRERFSDDLEGKRVVRSKVLRSVLLEGQALLEAGTRGRAKAIAAARGESLESVWRAVVEAGLRSLEKEASTEERKG